MANNPILTVKLTSVGESGTVGPNVRINLEVTNFGPPMHLGVAARNKFLCSAPFTSSTANVTITILEKDPVYDDTAEQQTLSLNASKSSPYPAAKKGHQNKTITVQGAGGDKGKTAKFTLEFDWFVSPNVKDVIEYIHGEMTRNVASQVAADIKRLVEAAKALGWRSWFMTADPEWAAMEKFKSMVGKGKPWDHKQPIRDQYGEFALDASRGVLYQYENWSNLHFGFIGAYIGFSQDLLLNAAGLANEIDRGGSLSTILQKLISGQLRDLDESQDSAAIRAGFRLWNNKGSRVTVADILEAVRQTRTNLKQKPAPEGVPSPSIVRET
jgi:hypothetical protein